MSFLPRVLVGASLLIMVTGCADPLQTDQYCLDVPSGSIADASVFANELARRLAFDISDAHPEFEPDNIQHEYLLNGRGVTVLVLSSMVSGDPDEFGNRPTTFDPKRYDLSAFKSGWFQRVEFSEVLDAASNVAIAQGLKFGPAPKELGCAT